MDNAEMKHGVRWTGGVYTHSAGYKAYTSNGKPDSGSAFFHRRLMEQHLGRKLGRDEVVHHINGDKSDNRIENLQVLTRSEHMKHHRPELMEKHHGLKGESNPLAKLTADAVRHIRYSKESLSALAGRFGVSEQAVWMARVGKTWKHVE